jgi:hydrogenase maturation protein HypF
MCPACASEYHDPANRRFHAQPTACPACGPRVWLHGPGGGPDVWDGEAIEAARDALRRGEVVAVKGVGGFHLACDARSDAAVSLLRERKGRVDKPFALMTRDLGLVRTFAEVGPEEERLLTGREKPIVLLPALDAPVSSLVAPGQRHLGVMLPYSPLHHLLLDEYPLVMTSGNRSDEPVAKDNAEALDRLAGLADAFLLHDRDIHAWCDDSVVRVFRGRVLPVRRSRGYAPFPVRLPVAVPPTLAVGGELKATFCLAAGRDAYLSQHIGDVGDLATLAALERAVDHFEGLFGIEPQRVVCDRHPGYLSARWAREYAARRGLPVVTVQHHHAHVAALLAEHGRPAGEPVIGVAFDGTGYGTDGAIWGGEFLIADYAGFRRAAHLRPMPLPGGDAGVRNVGRLGLAYLWAAGVPWDEGVPCVDATPPSVRRVLRRQLETGVNCVPTTSLGRLFDAVAAIAGGCQTATYEGQAAMELEAICQPQGGAYHFELSAGEPIECDWRPVVRAAAADARTAAPGVVAARFHTAVAELVGRVCRRLRERTSLNVIGLTGGVFQNVRLLGATAAVLEADGFRVLTHAAVPPNDAGLALGQAVAGSAAEP